MVYKRRDGIATHRCRQCTKTKTVDNFYQDASTKSGVTASCIQCLGGGEAYKERLLLQVPSMVDALIKQILDCRLCMRKGYVFTPPNKIATCVCHMRLLVKINDMQNEVVCYESVGDQENGGDDDPLKGNGDIKRRGVEES